jgi:hypothetical protein
LEENLNFYIRHFRNKNFQIAILILKGVQGGALLHPSGRAAGRRGAKSECMKLRMIEVI